MDGKISFSFFLISAVISNFYENLSIKICKLKRRQIMLENRHMKGVVMIVRNKQFFPNMIKGILLVCFFCVTCMVMETNVYAESSGLLLPPDAEYNSVSSNVFLFIMSFVGIGILILSFRDCLKTKSALPVAIATSGLFLCVPEVFIDIMGGLYFPSPDSVVFSILGRQMGWIIVIGWAVFAQIVIYIFYKLLEREVKTKILWLSLLIAIVGETIFEIVAVNLGVYIYFGNQPLYLLNFPLWYNIANLGGIFIAASLAYRYKEYLKGWKAIIMLLVTPLSVSANYGLIALPSWIVINGDYSWLLTQAAGLITIILGLGAVALCMNLLLERNPVDTKY